MVGGEERETWENFFFLVCCLDIVFCVFIRVVLDASVGKI